MSRQNVIHFPASAGSKKKRVDTIVLDAATLKTFRYPSFQRPFRMTPGVQSVVDEVKESGVFPGVLTLGVYANAVWVIDGQHRLEAVRISERTDVLADVHYLECESDDEMAAEYRKLNTALVRFNPDDILRAKEVSSPALQKIRSKCKFVGYDHVRRSDTSPILSMSATLRSWFGSEPEAPSNSVGSAALLGERITEDEASELCSFLNLAFVAWGRDPAYARLWGQLNLTLCAWLYRRIVVAPVVKAQRRVHLTREQFGKCLMSLSADSTYLDYTLGRRLTEEHRAPTFTRIKQIFVRRLRDEGIGHAILPLPTWASR